MWNRLQPSHLANVNWFTKQEIQINLASRNRDLCKKFLENKQKNFRLTEQEIFMGIPSHPQQSEREKPGSKVSKFFLSANQPP
jgi:hypothetical protein